MYPIMLDIRNKRCVVIGGGKAALMKAKKQRQCGAAVTVISPDFKACFDGFDVKKKKYEKRDIDEAFLVTAATDDKAQNRIIAADAREKGILIYAVDDPENSDIMLPAAASSGDITVTVSTNGKYPFLAKRLRDDFSAEIEYYASILPALEKYRRVVLAKEPLNKRDILKKAVDEEMLCILRKGADSYIKALDEIISKI